MFSLHQLLFDALWLATCVYALLRGGAPERLMAGAMLIAVISTDVTAIMLRPHATGYRSVEIGIAIVDIALFLFTVVLALTSARFWPMLMGSMLGCELFGHLARPLGPDIVPKAYYAMIAFWSYPSLLLLAVATWRHQMRRKRYGFDCSWVQDLSAHYVEGWSIESMPAIIDQP